MSILVFIIVLFPFSYKITQQTEQKHQDLLKFKANLQQISHFTTQNILYIQKTIKQINEINYFPLYCLNPYSMTYEEIENCHKEKCKNGKFCFCLY